LLEAFGKYCFGNNIALYVHHIVTNLAHCLNFFIKAISKILRPCPKKMKHGLGKIELMICTYAAIPLHVYLSLKELNLSMV
jgi:hypothetical protein